MKSQQQQQQQQQQQDKNKNKTIEYAHGKLLLNSRPILSGGCSSLSSAPARRANENEVLTKMLERDRSLAVLHKVSTNGAQDATNRHVLKFSEHTEDVVSAFMCTARCKLWWMSPQWGRELGRDLPAETQYLVLELNEGKDGYVCVLPLTGERFRATLSGYHPMWRRKGSFLIVESACEEVKSDGVENVAVISWAENPFDASKKAIKLASVCLKGAFKPRDEKVIPPVADVFGWCTWDAFYEKVSPMRIAKGLTSLQNGNSPPKFVIIDDGWQNVEADKEYRSASKNNSARTSRNSKDSSEHNSGEEDDEYYDDDEDDGEIEAPLTTPTVTPPGYFAAMIYAFYWRRLHAMRAHGALWHTWRILINYFLYAFVAMKTASLSYFNHRVVSIRANKKFASFTGFRRASFSGRRSPFGSLAQLAGKGMRKAIKTVGSVDFLQHLSPPTSPKFSHRNTSRHSLDSLRSADQQMDLAGHQKNEIQGQIDGLGNVVRAIKKKYDIDYVYCWHALLGYWGGVHPDEENVREFGAKLKYPRHNPSLLAVEPSQAWDPLTVCGVGVPAPEKMQHFYNELHEYLASAGVDGVKVDAQAIIGALGYGNGPNGGGPALARKTHEALEESVMQFFPTNGLVNCMCHSTENLYNFKKSNLARVSDDFYPSNEASHTVHIVNVAYNTMFMGEIVIPDWDMFQSASSTGGLHAAARAVGGCPVYVSDHPDKHDFNVLGQLVMPSGAILRGKLPGRPTRDCLFKDVCRDGKTALKIWNRNSVGGVIAAFNVQGACWSRQVNQYITLRKGGGQTVTGYIFPRDIEGFRQQYGQEEPHSNGLSNGINQTDNNNNSTMNNNNNNINSGDQKFAVRSHRTGSVDILRLNENTKVILSSKDWDVFTITPVFESFRARRSFPDESFDGDGTSSVDTSVPSTPEILSPIKKQIDRSASSNTNNEKLSKEQLIKKLKRANIKFACFGLTKMMNGNAVVQNAKLEKISSKSYRATVQLSKSCGECACFSSERPKKISATSRASNNRKHDVPWKYNDRTSMLVVDLGDIEDLGWTLFIDF